MHNKTFAKTFIILSGVLLLTIGGFNIIVDPYDVTRINLLHIEHKVVRDGRAQKINQLKTLKDIDNLILGSSRSERLNPATVSKFIGGYTYTFGMGGASIEDALGVLLFLEKENKFPKNIILCVDFSMFGESKPSVEFYNSPEINFLATKPPKIDYASKLFSIDATRASIKTLKFHLKKREPDSYIDEHGYLRSKHETPSGDQEKIQKVAQYYYDFNYKAGNISFSQERFDYLERIVALANKHDSRLYVMLTPVHKNLYTKIDENKKLSEKLVSFKQQLSSIAPFYDAMVLNLETMRDSNFEDAVHYNEKMGDYLLQQLFIQSKE